MADETSVGVIGAGVMGSGIAQTLASAGIRTICTDVDAQALERGRQNVVSGRYGLERAVARGKQSRADADAALARLSFTPSLDEAVATDPACNTAELLRERLLAWHSGDGSS